MKRLLTPFLLAAALICAVSACTVDESSYTKPIDNPNPAKLPSDPGEDDTIEIEFTSAILSYYWDYYRSGTGNFVLELFEGDFSLGTQDPTSYLYLDCFTSYFESFSDFVVSEGTYSYRNTMAEGTFWDSVFVPDFETYEEFRINGGQFSVSRSGGNTYTIISEFYLDSGEVLLGRFSGEISMYPYDDAEYSTRAPKMDSRLLRGSPSRP